VVALSAEPRSERLIQVAGVEVSVTEWGPADGPRLLLLHGGMVHARWWDLVAARLAERFRVLALDLPGHGDSPWLEPRRYTTRLEVEIVSALMAHDGSASWALGGHSRGALVASVVAARGAQPPARLVLVEMPLVPVSPRLMRAGHRLRTLRQPDYATAEEGIAAFKLFPGDSTAPPEVIRHVAEHSLRRQANGRYTSKYDWRFFRDRGPDGEAALLDFPALLSEIRCPTLVVRGEASTILTAAEHAEMVGRLPAGSGVVIAGSAHNPHVENPAATADALTAFLHCQ
jgi:pimeloyl-ACP methyl ester carboxylesterase